MLRSTQTGRKFPITFALGSHHSYHLGALQWAHSIETPSNHHVSLYHVSPHQEHPQQEDRDRVQVCLCRREQVAAEERRGEAGQAEGEALPGESAFFPSCPGDRFL